MSNPVLKRAVEIVGTQAEMARRISVKPAHVWNWLNRDAELPADAVRAISEATSWLVTPHDLRPDIYPNPDDGLPPDVRAKMDGIMVGWREPIAATTPGAD